MKLLLLVGLFLTFAGVASWRLLTPAQQSGPTEHDRAKSGQRPLEIQGIGYVEPASEVRKLMMRTGGVIKHCRFGVGDMIRKGEVILELEDATQRAELELAADNLAMLQADVANVNAGINPHKIKSSERTIERLREKLRHCKAEADRYRTMLTTKSVSHQDYESADTLRRQTELELKEQEADLESLKHYVTPENRAWQESRIKHAQANLELARARLGETKLLAPFDGTLLKVLKREGEGVRTFEPEAVVLFGDTSKLRVRAEIDERFVNRLTAGQSAIIYGRNLATQQYAGRIVSLEQVMGDKTVFTRASSERKDLDVLQVLIEMEPGFRMPIGLQVDVKVMVRGEGESAIAKGTNLPPDGK